MEQLVIIVRLTTLLCIALSLFLTPCCADYDHLQSIDAQAHDLSSIASLPRKLMVSQEVAKTETGIVPQMKAKETRAVTSKLHENKETKMNLKGGERWKEQWEDVNDPSDLFTMDYRRVRRRRPIHNKSYLPAGP